MDFNDIIRFKQCFDDSGFYFVSKYDYPEKFLHIPRSFLKQVKQNVFAFCPSGDT